MKKNTKVKKIFYDNYKLVIFCILFGIITHGMIVFNDFPNGDGILFDYYSTQNTVTSGRWMLGIFCSISGFFNVPFVIAALSFIYLDNMK